MNLQINQPQIHWQAAHQAVDAAAQKALELGVKINVAVVDAGGNRVAFLRMNGAPLHSIVIAEDKAFTAASFGLATDQWSAVLKLHSEAVQRGLPKVERFVMFGGGAPIRVDGELIGGIGVSGASEEQDGECARAGLAAIGLVA